MKYDKYMGMDVHQATTVVVVLDAEGKLILETIVETEAAANTTPPALSPQTSRVAARSVLSAIALRQRRRRAKQAMLAERRRHRAVTLLRTIPQLGPIRSAQIVATVDSPHRFRTKRQFWSYSGLAVVTHMSAEYEMKAGRVGAAEKAGRHARTESQLQPAVEGVVHRCGHRRQPE